MDMIPDDQTPARRDISVLAAKRAAGAAGPPGILSRVILSRGRPVEERSSSDRALAAPAVSPFDAGLAAGALAAAFTMRRRGPYDGYLPEAGPKPVLAGRVLRPSLPARSSMLLGAGRSTGRSFP